MSSLFENAAAVNPDMSSWDFSNVTNMNRMFLGIDIGVDKYSNLLIRLESQNENNSGFLGGGDAHYSPAGETARKALENDHGWVITDDGPEP